MQLVTIPARTSAEKALELELEQDPIAYQRAIVCRGTSCYLAKPIGAMKSDYVVKFSWISDQRIPEVDLLQKAHSLDVKGLAKLIGSHEVTTISSLREGLTFSKPHKFRNISLSASSSFRNCNPR